MKPLKDNWTEPRYKLTIADLIVVVAVILLAAVLSIYLFKSVDSSAARTAIIEQDGKVIRKIDLDSLKGKTEIDLSGEYSTVVIAENGRVSISSSTCRDKVCVKTGWLTKIGQSSVCLPNRVVVRIAGENSEFDGISR